MDQHALKALLQSVAAGGTSVDQAAETLSALSFETIDYAHIDHHRSLRKGFPEVIFGEGKSGEQIVGIMERMIRQERVVLVTRIDAEKARAVCGRIPESTYDSDARMVVWKKGPVQTGDSRGTVLVLAAGTSDIGVAKEAALTAEAMGSPVETVIDVGVSGIHRLFHYKEAIDRAMVLVVVAGMEGALPSVVAGMVARPVIAVPTSVGYGTSLGGITPLFAMLNSCSSNVAVVNIDNGFGAGYVAAMINRK